MQSVSPSYAPYTDLRVVALKVKFELIDTNAAEGGTASATRARYPTQIQQVMNGEGMSQNITDLTPNQWILNGTNKFIPQNISAIHTGYRSVLSNNDAKLPTTSQPTITVEFNQDISCIGFTINFDEFSPYAFASHFKIETYDANGQTVSQGEFDNDSTVATANLPSYKFRHADFIFTDTWLPMSSVNVASIIFGVIQNFTPDNIASASLIQEISLDMSNLPANQFSFTFENLSKSYNIINPAGIYKFLQDEQKIEPTFEINGETVNGGKYVFLSSATSNNGLTATINAGDYITALDGCTYSDTGTGTWSFKQAVNAVIAASGLNIETYIQPLSLANRLVYKAIPENTKCREALRMLAQAARCVLFFDRDNVLTAKEIGADNIVDSINEDNAESLSGVTNEGRINTVYLTVEDKTNNTKNIFKAQQLEDGEAERAASVSNPCAYEGQAVADWLLGVKSKAIKFTIPFRGNPALDPGDTVNIDNIFNVTTSAQITKITTSYDGGLKQAIEAQGE